MKLLIVAMAESIHTVRWVNQLVDMGWDIHIFPSTDNGVIHQDLNNVTIHSVLFDSKQSKLINVRRRGIPVPSALLTCAGMKSLEHLFPNYRGKYLRRLIRRLKPDIIHSMETQAAGYLTYKAKSGFSGRFPPWIHTVWGSDIFLFGKLEAHKRRIRNVLENCDYFICEGKRDVLLAQEFGFQGEVLLVSQATGGFDVPFCAALRSQGPVSSRRLIMLKGYQSWAGRALVGLRALERCADMLANYSVAIYSASPDVAIAAELFTAKTGVPTVVIPQVSHEEMLRMLGETKLSISLSISDGVPNSMLEAMVMGAFPIQSWTACTDEWINDGVNGLLVPPDDPEFIEKAIRRVLTDDNLVDNAAEINSLHVKERLDYVGMNEKARGVYCSVLENIDKLHR